MKKTIILAGALAGAMLVGPLMASATPENFTSINNSNGYTNVSIKGIQTPVAVTAPHGSKSLPWSAVKLACAYSSPCIATVVVNTSSNGSGGDKLAQTMSMDLNTGIVTPATLTGQVGNNIYTVVITNNGGANPTSTITCKTTSGGAC